MNDELEDKDLAELLKQIPAPDRLDADRRAAILAVLPKDEAHVGRPRRSRSTMLAHVVSLAAMIALMVLFGGLLIPNFLTTRSMKCAIDPVDCEKALPDSSMAPDQEVDGDGLVGIATKNTKKNEGGFAEQEAAKVLDEPALIPLLSTFGDTRADGQEGLAKRKESGRSDDWGVAAPAAESTPSGSSDSYASRLDVHASTAPAEAQKHGSGTGGALALGIDTTSSSSGLDIPQAGVAAAHEAVQAPAAAPPMSPKPAEMDAVAITQGTVIMGGIVSSRSSGQRGRALQTRGGVAELRAYDGVVAAEHEAGETMNRASAELSDKIVAAERLAEPQKADVAYKLGEQQMPARALREASDLPAGRYNDVFGRAPFGPEPKLEKAEQYLQKAEEEIASKSERRWKHPPETNKALDADMRIRLEKAKGYYATDELSKSREETEKILRDSPWSEDAVNMLRKVSIAENNDVSNERVIAREQMIKDVSLAWSTRSYGRGESVGGEVGEGSEQKAGDVLVVKVAADSQEREVLQNMEQLLQSTSDLSGKADAASEPVASDAQMQMACQEVAEDKAENVAAISEFATLENARRQLFDEHGRDMLKEGQAALRDRKPDVALKKFEEARKFLVEKEENREAIEQAKAGIREAFNQVRPRGEEVSDEILQEESSSITPAGDSSEVSNVGEAPGLAGNETAVVERMEYRMFNVLPATAQRITATPQEHLQDKAENAVDSEAFKRFSGELGVQWPEGSQCRYMPTMGKLVVKNTSEGLVDLQKVLDKLHEEDATPEPPPLTFAPFTLIPTAEHPLSTFGLDTDSAGYSRCAALISGGVRPTADMIRQEEFINAFEYGDTAPNEATFRIYIEGAQSPFRSGNNLLRVGVKGRRLGREEQRPLTLTILLDASGSMETPERMALARTAILALLKNLSPDDTVTLLTCADRTRESFRLTGWGDDQILETAKQALNAIRCQGATDLEDGIVNAYANAAASFNPHGENRVVIISDGIANLGNVNPENILAKVASYRDRGIRCSVIGVGHSTYNDTFLEAMANRGDGQYNFLDSEKSIDESFVNDLENSFNTIASDVKIQVEWDMKAVRAYRSHGYDSRALKDEQFRDDTVDAGEVGSGQGVAVVYEMQLEESAKPAAVLGTVRIRYRRVDTGAVEEIEEPITAEMVMRDFSGTRPQFRLACAVAEFATVLKHMPAEAQGAALRDVSSITDGAAMELDFYTPAKEFAETVKRLISLGL